MGKKKFLSKVTLLGVDCIDLERLIFASDICQKHLVFFDVKLLSHLPSKNKSVIKIPQLRTIEEYSYFMIKELYKYVESEYVLIIQHDGFILNPWVWSNEFLKFDYIGAIWGHGDNYDVGNGGFSLRSRRLLQMLAFDNCIFETHPEDYVICRTYGEYLRKKGIVFAPTKIANRFSIEVHKWSNQFGFHFANISDWNILNFADMQKHAKYIKKFNQTFNSQEKEGCIWD